MPSQPVSLSVGRAAIRGVLLTLGCGRTNPSPVGPERASIDIAGSPIELILSVQPEHAHDFNRFALAAATTLRRFGEWFGPLPYQQLTIVDPAWHSPGVT